MKNTTLRFGFVLLISSRKNVAVFLLLFLFLFLAVVATPPLTNPTVLLMQRRTPTLERRRRRIRRRQHSGTKRAPNLTLFENQDLFSQTVIFMFAERSGWQGRDEKRRGKFA
jgi:hypothetical protein